MNINIVKTTLVFVYVTDDTLPEALNNHYK